MRPGQAALLITLVALLGGCWSLPLGFELDDWMEIAKAPVTFGLEQRSVIVAGEYGPPLAGPAPQPYDYAQHHPLWRPVVWLALLAGWSVQSAPLEPWVFRVLPLLAHAACALLLWRALRRHLTETASVLGALLFALLPAGAQAWSWISACGDVFMTAFLLLALHCVQRLQSRGSALLLAAWCGVSLLALLSKESALPGLLLLALAHCALRGERTRLVRLGESAVALAPIVALMWLRAEVSGNVGLTYQGTVDASWSAALTALGGAAELLQRMICPLNSDPLCAGVQPLTAALLPTAAWIGPALLLGCALRFRMRAALRHTRAVLKACALWAVATLVLGLPALVLLPTHELNSLSRALYVLTVPLCALLAALWDLNAQKRVAALAIGLTCLVQLDLLVHGARTEALVSTQRETLLTQLRSATDGDSACTVAVLNTPLKRAGIPFAAHLLPLAFTQPFTTEPLRVLSVKDAADLALSDLCWSVPGPFVVADAQQGTAEILARYPAMPTLPEAPQAQRKAASTVEFSCRIPARAARGISMTMPGGKDRWLHAGVVIDGTERKFTLPMPAQESPRVIAWCLDDAAPSTGAITSVSLRADCLRHDLPQLQWLSAAPEISASGPEDLTAGSLPHIRCGALPHGTRGSLELLFTIAGMRVPLHYDFAVETLAAHDASAQELDFAQAKGPSGVFGGLGFMNVRERIESFTGSLTWTDVPCEWRFVAMTNDRKCILARSAWRRFLIRRG